MRKKKLKFSVIGFFLGGFFFFLSFVLIHAYWIGNPFENILSIILTIYLGICTWAFPYILKELDRIKYNPQGPVTFFFDLILVLLYFVSPAVYIWLKFFDEK